MAAFKNKIPRKYILSVALLSLGNILFFLTLWLLFKYDKVFLDQCLFQMKTSLSGVNSGVVGSGVLSVGGLGIGATLLEVYLYKFLCGTMKKLSSVNSSYRAYTTSKICTFFKNRMLYIVVSVFVFCAVFFVTELGVLAYVDTVNTDSDFIEDHYVDPKNVKLTFPEKKRNLIYIFLESMENTYADTSAGEPVNANYITELTMLAKDNVNFSGNGSLGGAYSYSGTTWTAASMVAQTAGLPVKVPFAADAYGSEIGFLPGVVSIGEILKDAGYSRTLIVGSDASFHGRRAYFTEHGDYEIIDVTSLKDEEKLPREYHEWWGFEDAKLYDFAKDELKELSLSDEPFCLTLLTADTHFPDGYLCHLCENTYDSQYANVLACSSAQLYEFVEWIKEQPFYENTTIVISGDHLSMDADFFEEIDENYVRTVYNCIINPAVAPVNEKNRKFGTFDMFPTTLAAIGVEIEGDRLALGTNLFSEEKTLTEIYGFDALNHELQKNSDFYNSRFLAME